jgi:putative glutamine amidotransferase
MRRRPKIGITTRLELDSGRFYLDRRYSEAVEMSGGLPVMIPLIPEEGYIESLFAQIDGLLLPGSNTDIDPAYYNEEPDPALGTVIPEKERTDLLALKYAFEKGIPVLAICFGMQVLNVFCGGSLIQDLRSEGIDAVKHDQGVPYERNSHSVRIDHGLILKSFSSVAEAHGEIRVNSSHHQAVRNIGSGLAAVGYSSDGVVEAIEGVDDGHWVLGVQWHPEMTFSFDPVSKEIFKIFVERSSDVAS